MLSPKQKAKELVDKFISHTNSDWDLCFDTAKQCALIAQKNLLDKLKSLNIKDEYEENVLSEIIVL
jgi:hypothetical protein